MRHDRLLLARHQQQQKKQSRLTHRGDGDLCRLDGDEAEEVDEHVQVVRREAQDTRLLHCIGIDL